MNNIGQQTISILQAMGDHHPKLVVILAAASVVTFIIALAVDALHRQQRQREKTPAISRRPR